MINIILVGSGGCMREIVWQMQEQNAKELYWNMEGYVDCEKPENEAGVKVGKQLLPYLGNDDYLLEKNAEVNVAVCVGNPAARKRIAEKLQKNPLIRFPNIILGNTRICEDVKIGTGCIISMDTSISTNVTIGNFVFLNIGSMVCHDGKISDFVTLSPYAKLAGNVSIGRNCEIGMETKIIQGIHVGENTVSGAGSVIVQDIDGNCTVAGVPAKKIRG